MPSITRNNSLANLIAAARKGGKKLPLPSEDLLPPDGEAAEAVQVAAALQLGGIGGYKVMRAKDSETGLWGIVPAPRVYAAPASLQISDIAFPELLVELEVAFRFAADLPGHEDGSDYATEEVEAALEGALPVYELLTQRWQTVAPALFPPVLLNRADALGNFGLVYGKIVKDWKPLVHEAVKANLSIAGKEVVAQEGGHVSGHPAAPLTWLANTLARHGHGIVAGQIVTTGAFGGAHLLKAGEEAVGKIAGFEPITLKLS